jgi:1-acyl-sn-glycerol-3-phosphate acyltransferase
MAGARIGATPPGVVAARSPARCAIFGAIMRRQMRRHFHAVRIAKAGPLRLPDGRAAIVYSNHPSWWDPAFFIVLATTRLPHRKGYGPMDAKALEQYSFMRRIGIFGIERDTRRGAAAFWRTSRAILADPEAVLWVTAEGGFADPRVRPVRLRPGTAHLMARTTGIVAVPLALEYPYWTERLPEAVCRFGEPMAAGDGSSVASWQSRLEERLGAVMDALAADVQSRDPARFEVILRGQSGIGGVYDLFRRARAMVRGERFVPEHGGPEA